MAGYLTHFGLKRAPFSTTPDPEFAYATREHQLAIAKIQYVVDERQGFFLLQGDNGTGKCLGYDTPVLMHDGTVKPVQEICSGDRLMGPDSLPRTVLSTACGVDHLYRVTPAKGDSYVVNEPHILSLRVVPSAGGALKKKRGQIINISVKEYLQTHKTFQQMTHGWRTGVDFTEQPILLEPYFLGVWLGDGCEDTPRITAVDAPVVEYLEGFAQRMGLALRPVVIKGDRCPMYDLTSGRARLRDTAQGALVANNNPVRDALSRYRLMNRKHIPQEYKANSEEVRLELLAGLIDTDGSLDTGGYEITTKIRQLADDILFVARSLGFAAYRKPCKKICCNNGVIGDYFRLYISGDVARIPVRLPRKQAAPRLQRKNVLRTSIRVEPIGRGAYFGFEIDGDGLFLLGDFTVTHNTTISEFLLNNWREDKTLAVAYLPNPAARTPSQFLRLLLSSYGQEPPRLQQDCWDGLSGFLAAGHKAGRTTVLVIDEAQTISAENMETLTHISNLQTQRSKLIQIVLLAQPNIARKLTYKPALRDRIAHGSVLNPLTYEDALELLRYRVKQAGGDFEAIFPAEVTHPIYNATKGIPRRLCMLCDGMMLNAYALGRKQAGLEELESALVDLKFKGWKDKD